MGKRSSKPGTCQRLSYPFTVNYSRDEIHSCQNHLLLRAFKCFKNIQALELNEDLDKREKMEFGNHAVHLCAYMWFLHRSYKQSKIKNQDDIRQLSVFLF